MELNLFLLIIYLHRCVFEQGSLCVIGLAQTHVALQTEGGITSVDFNVGKSDRSEFKVSGKRKKVMKLACVLCYILFILSTCHYVMRFGLRLGVVGGRMYATLCVY